ncbi:integral membrane transport protein [Streptomyces celluloflavus]|uniref:integral membrane transport protein n=1 Tax=Streptomyces celluloflavus TaxID=58344 RepID=UPI003699E5F9
MTTVSDAAQVRAAQPGGGPGRSVRDSLVVAQRNLIRMKRIPNRVRPSQLSFSSEVRRLNAAGKEQAK